MSGAPGRVPRLLVRTAVRVLPPGPTRTRYREELLADLYGLGRLRQLSEATTVLTHCVALRGAVDTTKDQEAVMTTSASARKPLLCYLHHKLRTVVLDDGATIRRCVRCGADHFDGIGGNNAAGAYIGNWISGPSPM